MFALAAGFQVDGAVRLVNSIDWTKPTWDLFIVLFFIVAAFLYGISLGRDRIMVILVSIYMALAVVNSAPQEIVIKNVFAIRVSAFLGIFLLLFFLLSRSALLKTIASSDTKGSAIHVFVFSILHVGLLISVVLSFLPSSGVDKLAPLTRTLFVTPTAHFLWIIAPILVMSLIRGGASKEKKYKYDV